MKDLKRLKILAGIFVASLALAVYTLTGGSSGKAGSKQAAIAVSDTTGIVAVLIQNKASKNRLSLTRESRSWNVNNKYPVRDHLQRLLLLGLNKMQVKREVPEQSRKAVYEKITGEGIAVQVLGKENIPAASFSLLPNESDVNSCYYLADKDSIPYIIYVPGFSGNITNIFSLGEDDWRTRIFYTGTEQTLAKIVLTYPEDPGNNIEIAYSDGGFHLAGKNSIDTARFYGYVNQFARITVNNYISEGKDSILGLLKSRLPLAKLKIEDIRGNKELDIYISPAGDALYGVIPGEGKELVKLSPETFNPIIAGRSVFVKK